ncbi:MAG TPA: ATP-binding protein [Thermoleophilaceae bacterium]|nr:ATP-binding protein [Thermoleophilaceae bacterium]
MTTLPRSCAPALAAALLAACFGAPSTARADDARGRTFLVLETNTTRPGFQEYAEGLRDVLTGSDPARATLAIEDLEITDEPHAAQFARARTWLGAKYRGRAIEGVFSTSAVPVDIVVALRDELWPGKPISIAGGSSVGAPGLHAQPFGRGFDGAVAATRSMFPRTRRIVFVGGASYGDVMGQQALEPLRRTASASGLAVETLEGLSLTELEQRVSTLPPDAVVFFSVVNRDRTGTRFRPRDVLDLLAASANRPIFGFATTYLRHGIVGGDLVDLREVGRACAEQMQQLLATGRARPPTDLGSRLAFDHDQLRRWGVRESHLPSGADVLFRPPTLWQSHREEVLAGLAASLLQSAFIGWLFVESRKRRRAEDRLHALSRSLMRAQEGERARLSRELHDDVNQRLALLAIGFDAFASGGDLADSMRERARALAEESRRLGSDLHGLARRLRPPQLDSSGLPSALRALGAQVQAASLIEIEVATRDWPGELPADVAIVFYRVAQEALHNVVKHSRATRARVALHGSRRLLVLDVHDDGLGIEQPREGLGLVGMRERLALLGGHLHLSAPSGEGTHVVAHVPLPLRLLPPEETEEPADVPPARPAR